MPKTPRVTVKYDREWDQWAAVWYGRDGKRDEAKTYYASDKEDAEGSAKFMRQDQKAMLGQPRGGRFTVKFKRRKKPRLRGLVRGDKIGKQELSLFIDSDGQLYRERTKWIVKSQANKIKRGVYNPRAAVRAWQYLIDEGTRKYCKEHTDIPQNRCLRDGPFNKKVRTSLAREYAKDFRQRCKRGEIKECE